MDTSMSSHPVLHLTRAQLDDLTRICLFLNEISTRDSLSFVERRAAASNSKTLGCVVAYLCAGWEDHHGPDSISDIRECLSIIEGWAEPHHVPTASYRQPV